jgi:hypothetical protein
VELTSHSQSPLAFVLFDSSSYWKQKRELPLSPRESRMRSVRRADPSSPNMALPRFTRQPSLWERSTRNFHRPAPEEAGSRRTIVRVLSMKASQKSGGSGRAYSASKNGKETRSSTIELLSFVDLGPGLRSSRPRGGLGRLGCDPLALRRSKAFRPRLAALLADLPHSFPECFSIHGRILTPYLARWRKAAKDVFDTLASKV